MTTGSWVPDSEKSSLLLPGEETLASWAVLSEADIKSLDNGTLSTLKQTVHAGVDNWQAHLEKCDPSMLLDLLKFFTLTEMAHTELRTDKHNPAIACAKLLRRSGNGLDKELLQWIRNVSDNRYLPYGPL